MSARPREQVRLLLKTLPPMDMAGRMGRTRALMDKAGCGTLLVSKLANVRYLTGFTGSAGILVVRPDDAVLVTDGRYGLQAPTELARAGVVAEVEAVAEPEQMELLRDLTAGRTVVGLEAEHVSWARQRQYARALGRGKKLLATTGLVESLRERKDQGELARIAAAARVTDAAFGAVQALLQQRPREAELAASLEAEMRRLGADTPAFETIVAAGPNAAEPHHNPSRHRLGRGELVVVDCGARVDGYCSDMTRTVRVGEPDEVPSELRRVATVVMASQDAGLSAVRDGARCSEIDRACREVVEAAGMAEFFVHGTGHGVGLDIHEAPSLARLSADILSSGQVVTVEPGVYVPGLGGARTEDTVVVNGTGCEVLTLTPKQAQTVLGRQKRQQRPGSAAKAQ